MSAMVDEPVELVARVCAIDIGKSALVACVRVPHDSVPGRRAQQVRELATNHRALLALVDWLRCERVELVAMEATSDYWKPVFYRLEAEGFTCWLLNARHVKNVPGRPKTDYYQSKLNTHRRQRDLIRQLEHLTGQAVTLRPAG